MTRLLQGFAAGALLLGWPWIWRPWAVAAGVAASLVVLLAVGLAWRCFAAVRPGTRGHGLPLRPLLLGATGLVVATAWSAAQHERALAARLPAPALRDAAPLVVRVAGEPALLPALADGALALRFPAEILEGTGRAGQWIGRVVRLSWYGAQPVIPGETWRVAATLRPPLGYANPGGFDFERWHFGQGIDGTGSIRRGVRLAEANPGWLAQARRALVGFIRGQPLEHGPILVAQLVAVGLDIPAQQWEVFRATGTVHLMVISGSHIALAAGFGFGLGCGLARLLPFLLLRVSAQTVGAWVGALAGAAYFGLAGGDLPSLRAALMAAPALLLAAAGRRTRPGAVLVAALAVVLAYDPLAVHQHGFWLSFAAVALLVSRHATSYHRRPLWRAFLGAQLLVSLGLAPLLLVLTGMFPPVSVPANLVAVPVISFGVVPVVLLAAMLAAVLPGAAALLLQLADALVGVLFDFLALCAVLPALRAEPARWAAAIALAAAAAWQAGVTLRHGMLLAFAVCCAALPRPTGVEHGHFRVTALDVGQGDAVLVDTARHRLLFDAGPAHAGGFDAGSAIVVPSLLATGPGRLDALVLSHEDVDHVGGAGSVERSIPVASVLASFPRPGALPCAAAQWRWDGVTFRLLDVPRPVEHDRQSGRNDRSCILLVDDGRARALLAGDIGAAVERRLRGLLAGPVELLLAPHHGSATSSSRVFVRALDPGIVFVSAGRDNRYGHPHPAVVARYRAQGSRLLGTADAGALVWHSAAPAEAFGWREAVAPYWRSSARAAGGN